MNLSAAPAVSAPSSERLARAVIPAAALAVLTLPEVPAAAALLAGIGVALSLGNPWASQTRALAHRTLAWSVIGLGAGMDLRVVGRVGAHGLAYTALGITFTLVVGTLLGRRFNVARDTSLLVTVGTAICGGSAIAAVAPVIRAKDHDVSMSLVTVFLLNGVALFLFPPIGRALHMDQGPFGLWCALAIHDTSSVVAAAARYGDRALEVATAAKLARALWIVPVTLAIAKARARSTDDERVRGPRPWFIGGFLAAAALVTYVPALRAVGHAVAMGAHRAIAVTLFLIGLGLSRPALRSLGVRPLLQATILWGLMATATLSAILLGWVT